MSCSPRATLLESILGLLGAMALSLFPVDEVEALGLEKPG
jgi:hypothetical protein